MTETETVCWYCGFEIAPGGDCPGCFPEYDATTCPLGEVVAVDHETLGRVYVVADGSADPCDPSAEWRADPARFR